ncbi:MAG: DUF418 domain-containing protein [Hyphomonadaceae bacterium]
MSETAPAPAAERIDALDMLRGAAILGILFMNIIALGVSMVGGEHPPLYIRSPADEAAYLTLGTAVAGTMRGMLSLLFGAGVILVTKAMDERPYPQAADIYYRRTIALVVMGIVHGYVVLWPGDILMIYGLAGFFLFPWRKVRASRLIAAGVVGIALMSAVGSFGAWHSHQEIAEAQAIAARDASTWTAEERTQVEEWRASARGPSPEEIAEEHEMRMGGYLQNARLMVRIMELWNGWGGLVWWTLDALSFMLIGMGLFKLGVLSGTRSLQFYAIGALVFYGIGLPSSYLATHTQMADNFAPGGPLWPVATMQLRRLAVTLGHVCLLLALWKSFAQPVLRVVLAPGRAALSVYIGQSVLCTLLFAGFGLGLHARYMLADLMLIAAGVNAVLMILAWGWLAFFRMGPLEWAWRGFTYGKLPPLRR